MLFVISVLRGFIALMREAEAWGLCTKKRGGRVYAFLFYCIIRQVI
jgi:hypothetical protein